MRTLRWAVAVKASSAGMNSTARIFPTVCCFGASGWDGVDAAASAGWRAQLRTAPGSSAPGRVAGRLPGWLRHGLRGGLLCRGHVRRRGFQHQPDAQRRLIIFRPGVGVFFGDSGGHTGGGFHQIAADVAGFDPRRPEQHRRRRGEVDAVARFGAFQKPQSEIRLPLAHPGGIQIVPGGSADVVPDLLCPLHGGGSVTQNICKKGFRPGAGRVREGKIGRSCTGRSRRPGNCRCPPVVRQSGAGDDVFGVCPGVAHISADECHAPGGIIGQVQ